MLVISQKGLLKTIIPDVTARFDEDMIVLEKWSPNKPISAIYFHGEKELFYVKRFLIENEEKEETFLPEVEGSYVEVVSTDYKPMAELVFNKPRGKEQPPNESVNVDEFISVKGMSAQGNQLTKSKVKQINWLESLPYEEPEITPAIEVEVVEENIVAATITNEESTSGKPVIEIDKEDDKPDPDIDDSGQASLF